MQREERTQDIGAMALAANRTSARGLPGLRWWVIGLVFLATVINYVDRQTINVLSPIILRDLSLDKIAFSRISAAFLAAYTIGMAVWGRLFDRFGIRVCFAVAITVWSIAAGLHALAGGAVALAVFRFLLGFGEAGNWPGAGKTVAEWFPARERALALAVFNSGAALGAVIAPPLITWVQAHHGWPRTFAFTSAAGFVWLVAWLMFYRAPGRHPWLRAEERRLIEEGRGASAAVEAGLPLRALLRRRKVWAIIAARLLTDPIWWLYLVWLPQYLFEVRGFDIKQIGAFAWFPYLCADAGALTGGILSGRLIARGWTVDRARKACLVLGALLMPAGIAATRVSDPFAALGLISVVLFAFQLWINNVQALPADLFPASVVGGVFGLGGAAAGIGSLALMLLSGWLVQNFSYGPMFTLAGLLGPIGLIALLLLVGRIERQPLAGVDRP